MKPAKNGMIASASPTARTIARPDREPTSARAHARAGAMRPHARRLPCGAQKSTK